jgi:hypothetical protein
MLESAYCTRHAGLDPASILLLSPKRFEEGGSRIKSGMTIHPESRTR